MSGSEAGAGVAVVSARAGGGFSLGAAALRGVLRAELRALPVAVLSVAGATRGGKSFLLDFCLRYLRATPAAQKDGSWIGAEDAPLVGFSWRGGWQRNTTGIHIWSEPIVVTRNVNGTKQKMVVILMDTQGTFDNSSTVHECTTIFALSTLMSSVQVYNLAQQIKEDDLQHLQLFTEYGKLALTETDSKPFQSLVFRVRDWMCPYEHPYGAAGGDAYLESILSVGENQNPELRELREHIRDSFSSISCFLTPHPGFAVTDENFSGRLCDLRPEFVDSLLGFIPSLLESSRLIPKVINGQEIVFGDLLTYFNSYVDIFNSEELPTPVSILKATSAACLEAARGSARALYEERMTQSGEGKCFSRAVLLRRHAAALSAARDAFLQRRTLAAPERAAETLDLLMQELNDLLPTYTGLNDAKTQRLVVDSRAAYDAYIAGVAGSRSLCLHPRDVRDAHAQATAAAMTVFDAGREPLQQEELDQDRIALMQVLEAKFADIKAASDLTNAAAVSQACTLYNASMQRVVRDGAVSAARLRTEHERAADAARQDFANSRSRTSHYPDSDDSFLSCVMRHIQEQFDYLESVNKGSSKSAKQAALYSYNNQMSSVWGPHMACLHPDILSTEHQRALKRALEEFRAVSKDEEQEDNIKEIIAQRYDEIYAMNLSANESLVREAYNVYTQKMDSKCTPSLASILVVPWLLKVLVMIPKFHQQYSKEALNYFRNKRRGPGDDDVYVDNLKKKLDAGFDTYRHPLNALAREFGIPTLNTP